MKKGVKIVSVALKNFPIYILKLFADNVFLSYDSDGDNQDF